MSAMQVFGLFVGLLLLAVATVNAQQLSNDAASSPPNTSTPSADYTPPQLLPFQRTLAASNTCKEEAYGTVTLSLVIDRHGIPGRITVVNPIDTSIEKLALRLIAEDSFKPAALKDQAAEVRGSISISILACFVPGQDQAGNPTEFLRLKEQPVQTLGKFTPVQSGGQDEAPGADSRLTSLPARITTGVTPPVALNHIEAEFSKEARREHFSGDCLISVIVSAEGKPVNPHVVRALGHGLDEKAIEAVNKYRFKPAIKNGTPIPVMINVEVRFRFTDY